MKIQNLKKLGPGLLFAGAAIGVSHLVQSTRAGADFGFGLLWALLISIILKYPFFQYGSRFALATKMSLLDGYYKLGKIYLLIFFIISIGTIFTIQTAVTIVTASLATTILGDSQNLVILSTLIILLCFLILLFGNYKLLDNLIKIIILALTVSTLIALLVALIKNSNSFNFSQVFPYKTSIIFLAALIGWMPAPLDISVWQSLWIIEKRKSNTISFDEGIFDFNVGYFGTFILGICFLSLGALVMFGSSVGFSDVGSIFAGQFIELYTSTLGESVYPIIVIAAFTTMFSTTLTTLDASPRSMYKSSQLLFPKTNLLDYKFWLIVLSIGTICIFSFLLDEMGTLVQIATVLSFITAPFYAYLNLKLVTSNLMPSKHKPSKILISFSYVGLAFLTLFALVFVKIII
ncbi:MAG: divalent metal cation transporter [Flavobacteriales bacterium]|nr:MAG: divalent metal cation transporter [Flavobacteriales bacterium TMED96]RZP09934.1 MAG: divalent metal cation transporter [Flavobacteriales bacterium]|tara:strand:- start:8105 stop:9319 length:1215 start_codon:yes stop_codon:yes gene_type:complete